MLKYQKWIVAFVALLVAWLTLLQACAQLELDARFTQVTYALPMYLLVCFGAYSLATIALSVMSIEDCGQAAKELEQEVVQAKADLQAKGFKF